MRRRIFSFKKSNAVVSNFDLSIDTQGSSYFEFPNAYGVLNNVTVDWGDGNIVSYSTTSNIGWSYTSDGVYNISVSGVLEGIVFNYSGQNLKLLNISSWGQFSLYANSFSDCANLTCTATNAPIITQLDIQNCFVYCVNINPDVSSWDTSAVAVMPYMFLYCGSFDQSLANWSIQTLGDATGFLEFGQLSTANYDATLISWANQPIINPGVIIDFGTSQYTAGGAAQAAWETLVFTYGWTIIDGGSI